MHVFGTTADGREVHAVRLRGGRLEADVLTLGGIVQRLALDGWPHPLTLGFAEVADYERVRGFVGAVAGRYANRIARARFPLDGRTVELLANDGANTLHGGPDGFSARIWRIEAVTERSVELALVSPDGDQGFPGTLTARLTYRLGDDDSLEVVFTATTDAVTVVNLTQHSYYNLLGAGTIDGHRLQVAAGRFVPVDAAGLPLDGPAAVAGTAFDFLRPRGLAGVRVDHNYCLAETRRPAPVPAATLAVDGLAMTLATTEPGLQVYTGDKLERGPGPRAGVCLEPQTWPDAPNRELFASPVLRPGETYRHHTRLVFALG